MGYGSVWLRPQGQLQLGKKKKKPHDKVNNRHMQSLFTSDTFCTAVNQKTQTLWGVRVEQGDVAQQWEG